MDLERSLSDGVIVVDKGFFLWLRSENFLTRSQRSATRAVKHKRTHMSMGKHNSKKQKNANGASILPKTPVQSTFDESALSALTNTIEKSLNGSKSRSNQNIDAQISQSIRESGFKKSKSQKGISSEPSTSKKRDASGNLKARPPNSIKFDRDVLLQEILNLGGTEEDLDLIGDADSEDDYTSAAANSLVDDSQFAKELSKFVTGLGIAGQPEEAPEDLDEEDQSGEVDIQDLGDSGEEGSEGDEWEDMSMKEIHSASSPPTKPKDIRIVEKSAKETNRLVSMTTIMTQRTLKLTLLDF